jgi:hypothetical protein
MRYLNCIASVVVSVVSLLTPPVFAQMDFSGVWDPIRSEDNFEGHPYPGEYVGLPINDAARARALSWEASIQTLY